jgi:hypothetical protein
VKILKIILQFLSYCRFFNRLGQEINVLELVVDKIDKNSKISPRKRMCKKKALLSNFDTRQGHEPLFNIYAFTNANLLLLFF